MKLPYDKKAEGLAAEVREYLTSSQSGTPRYIFFKNKINHIIEMKDTMNFCLHV